MAGRTEQDVRNKSLMITRIIHYFIYSPPKATFSSLMVPNYILRDLIIVSFSTW